MSCLLLSLSLSLFPLLGLAHLSLCTFGLSLSYYYSFPATLSLSLFLSLSLPLSLSLGSAIFWQTGLRVNDVQWAMLLSCCWESPWHCGTQESQVHTHNVWGDHQNTQPHNVSHQSYPWCRGQYSFPVAFWGKRKSIERLIIRYLKLIGSLLLDDGVLREGFRCSVACSVRSSWRCGSGSSFRAHGWYLWFHFEFFCSSWRSGGG